jgi:hypothetical protein
MDLPGDGFRLGRCTKSPQIRGIQKGTVERILLSPAQEYFQETPAASSKFKEV